MAATTKLWKQYNGKGFAAEYAEYAERASKDEKGNNISGTYAINKSMTGATLQADGVAGLVPAPLIADKDKYLKGDGTWNTVNVLPSSTSTDFGKVLSVNQSGDAEWAQHSWTSADKNVPPEEGVVIGGRKYEYKRFGNQLWMMESLKYDIQDSANLYINQSQGMYYYKADYLFNSADFAALIPEGWRIPTHADRDALVYIAGVNDAGARYMFNNFNVEPSSMYNGYGTAPGSYIYDWQFLIVVIGDFVSGLYINNQVPPYLRESDNLGGDGRNVFVPVRLCKDAE